jgi:hypothetical protein
MNSHVRVRLHATVISIAVLTLGLSLPRMSHAGTTPVYKSFKPGKSVNKAFHSLTRRYRKLRPLYRSNKRLHWVNKITKSGIGNMALLPVTASYIGIAGHQSVKNVQFLSEAFARGNTAEIVGGVLMTTIVAGFAVGNAWLSKATIQSGRSRFARARQLRGFARRDTIKTLIASPDLQRQVNRGQLLPASEIKVLRSLAKSLPKPAASYQPAGEAGSVAIP